MNLSDKYKGIFFVVTTLLIWSLFAIFSRMMGKQYLNSWDLTFIRFSFAFVLICIYLIWHKKFIRFNLQHALILSLFGGVGYCAIVYLGFLYAPVTHSAIWLNACIPVSIFLLSALCMKQPVQKDEVRVFTTIVVSIVGMLMVGYFSQSYIFSIGDLCFFIGSLFWAAYTLLIRKFNTSIQEALVGVTFVSFITYLPIYLFFLPKNILQESISVILMQGIFHGVFMVILASITFIKSIEYLGAIKAGSILALAPFIAVILAIPLLGEWPDQASIIGMMGLLIAVIRPWKWKEIKPLSSRE